MAYGPKCLSVDPKQLKRAECWEEKIDQHLKKNGINSCVRVDLRDLLIYVDHPTDEMKEILTRRYLDEGWKTITWDSFVITFRS